MVDKDFGGEGGVKQEKRRNWQSILLPIVGLLLIIASGIIAYILSLPLAKMIMERVPEITIPVSQFQLATGSGIFIILLLVFAVIYSAIAPKPPRGVSESELDKEKRERLEEEMRAKRRRRDMKNKMRQSRNK